MHGFGNGYARRGTIPSFVHMYESRTKRTYHVSRARLYERKLTLSSVSKICGKSGFKKADYKPGKVRYIGRGPQ